MRPAWHQCARAGRHPKRGRRPAPARLEAATPRGKPAGGIAAPWPRAAFKAALRGAAIIAALVFSWPARKRRLKAAAHFTGATVPELRAPALSTPPPNWLPQSLRVAFQRGLAAGDRLQSAVLWRTACRAETRWRGLMPGGPVGPRSRWRERSFRLKSKPAGVRRATVVPQGVCTMWGLKRKEVTEP